MLKNYTPHEVVIFNNNGDVVLSLPSIGVARVTSQSLPKTEIDGIPVVETVFGEVSGLPEPEDGTFYIVSQFVIAALPTRTDLLRPDTGPTCVRDADGKIIGVKALTT